MNDTSLINRIKACLSELADEKDALLESNRRNPKWYTTMTGSEKRLFNTNNDKSHGMSIVINRIREIIEDDGHTPTS